MKSYTQQVTGSIFLLLPAPPVLKITLPDNYQTQRGWQRCSRSGSVSQPVEKPGGKRTGKHQVVYPVLRHQMLTEQSSYLLSLCSAIHAVNSVQLFGFHKK